MNHPTPLLWKSVLILAPLIVAAAPGAPTTWKVGKASASFDGKGPAGFKLKGDTDALELSDDGKALSVVVHLTGLKTGVGLRDKHMREKYLQVEKYPDAILLVAWDAVRLPDDGQRLEGKATGAMSLHGTTKDVSFTYSIRRTGESFEVTGSVPLNMKDFGIDIPSYMGITVQPDIEASVTFSATRS